MRTHISQSGWRDAHRSVTPAFPLIPNERRERLERGRELEHELTPEREVRGGHPVLAKLLFVVLFAGVLALAAQVVPWSEMRAFFTGMIRGL